MKTRFLKDMNEDISILVYDHNLNNPNIGFADNCLKEEIKGLENLGYQVTTTAYSKDVVPNYDIIVAHPEWGLTASLAIFVKENPGIQFIIDSGAAKIIGSRYEISKDHGYFHDVDGTYIAGTCVLLNDFLELIEDISTKIRKEKILSK